MKPRIRLLPLGVCLGWIAATLANGAATLAADEVNFAVTELTVSENGVVSTEVLRTGGTGQLTVQFQLGGTATLGLDYDPPIEEGITVYQDSDRGYFYLWMRDDADEEPPETLEIRLVPGPGYTVGAAGTLVVTITDNDPSVTLGAPEPTGAEAGPTAGRFEVTRTGDLNRQFVVNYEVGGDAVPGADYTPLPGQITFAAGQASVSIPVEVRDDAVRDGDRVVTVTLVAGPIYTLGAPASAAVVIADNESPNRMPVVRIAEPATGTLYSTETEVAVVASAEDPDGVVSRVALYDNGRKLDETPAAPYRWNVRLAPGVHTLVAVATDGLGGVGHSVPVGLRVGCPSPPDSAVYAGSVPVPGASSPTAHGDSMGPIFSRDGRWLAFVSQAGNLVEGDSATSGLGGWMDVFVHDLETGANTLASVNQFGSAGGNGNSVAPELSADGRHLVFQSRADDLAAADANGQTDVFWRDLRSGTTRLISANVSGDASGNGPSGAASLSDDGQTVVFESLATDLVAGDGNRLSDVFVRDVANNETRLVSVARTGSGSGNGASTEPRVSADGQRVAFLSTATDLVTGVGSNSRHVYLVNRASEATFWASTNAARLWQQAFRSLPTALTCFNAALSADGRYVAFCVGPAGSGSTPGVLVIRHDWATGVSDLVASNALPYAAARLTESGPALSRDGQRLVYTAGGNTAVAGVYLWDTTDRTLRLVSVNAAGDRPAAGTASSPHLSADGRVVTFLSNSPDLVGGIGNGVFQLYARDVSEGRTRLVSARFTGLGVGESDLLLPALSPDGARVAFATRDEAVVTGDANEACDVFVRDLASERTTLISAHASGLAPASPNGPSGLTGVSITPTGQFVAFTSQATDLVAGDTNGVGDVFVRDVTRAVTTLISVNQAGAPANGTSEQPTVSADGQRVAFLSRATDLTPFSPLGYAQVYVRDLELGRTELASLNRLGAAAGRGDCQAPILSADGRWVTFVSTASDLAANDTSSTDDLFLRDLAGRVTTRILVGNTFTPMYRTYLPLALPVFTNILQFPGGNVTNIWPGVWFVMGTTLMSPRSTNLYFYDHNRRTNLTAGAVVSLPFVSQGGRFAAYASYTNGANQFFVYDMVEARIITPFGAMPAGSLPLDLSTVAASVSADGRRVAFTSRLPLDADRDLNGASDVYLYDTATRRLDLVSRNRQDTLAGNGHSTAPLLGADGRLLAFRSEATDLVFEPLAGANLFIRDLDTGRTWCAAPPPDGLASGSQPSLPVFSSDAQTLLFTSRVGLTPNDLNGYRDVFVLPLHPTCPVDADSDALDDDWEWANFGGFDRDGSGDLDADGLDDRDEFHAGTSPSDPASVLRVWAAVLDGTRVRLTWPAVPGRKYRIEHRDDLGEATWEVSLPELRATQPQLTYDEAILPAHPRFYRILVLAP